MVSDNLQRILDATVLLLFFALPVTTVLGGVFFVPWRRPYWTLAWIGRVMRLHGWVLAGLIGMLVPEFIESQVDPLVDEVTGFDFTPMLKGLEDGFHAWLQTSLVPLQPFLQPVLTAAYVVGYPALIILTPVLGVWLDQRILARRALGAYALCYAFALPFYLFFPVDETWYAYNTCPPGSPMDLAACNNGSVVNLAIQSPFVLKNIYAYNELNNCFPSLHTAMSVALAAVAWRGGAPRNYVAFAATLAGAIVVATIYLGIHWVTDVVAGLLLAAGVVLLVERFWPDRPQPAPAPEAAL